MNVVGKCVPGGRTRMRERMLAELHAQPYGREYSPSMRWRMIEDPERGLLAMTD